jgi:serine/threonine protein kinase
MASELSSPPVPAHAPRRPAGFVPTEMPRRFGRYALLRRIAKGGMGEVCLAASLGLEGAERPVIVKTIRAEHRTDASFKARFLDEARVQAQLEHSGVAQVLEATTDDDSGEPYVVVEYIDGRSLGEVRSRALASSQAILWHEAVAVAQLVAEALAHVHERRDPQGQPLGIVHRDLSPQNLMVSYGGDVKIIDFGTARGENRRCHTVAGVVYAKPGYTAPEVANGDSGDYRVDLYALGVMLWELCTGRRFLSGDASDHLTAVAKNSRNVPPVAALVKAPPELDAVLHKLTAFDRADRYPRTRDAARELASLLAAAPSLTGGERGVRGRVASLMHRLFDGESARARREFLRLVAEARQVLGPMSFRTPQAPTPKVAHAMRDEEQGLLPGTRWKLFGELGRGAGSVVHEAEHLDLGRRAAIKVLTAPSPDDESIARLRREARVMASLANVDGVARVLDTGRSLDGRAYSVMELREGQTLDKVVAKRGTPMPWSEALTLAGRVLDVLGRVHASGVVHRDVKPQNLLVTDAGIPTLLDFGLAIAKSEPSEAESPVQSRACLEVFGTPEYMAPEQVARPHDVDARADVYALGATLYELVTGSLPFANELPMALLEQKTQGSPDAPSVRAPGLGIPREVDELVLRAIARHPSLRFESALEMRQAIDAALAAPARVATRRRRAGFAALGAALCCAAALIGLRAPEGRAALGRAKTALVERFVRTPEADTIAKDAVASTEAPAAAPTDPLAAQGVAPTAQPLATVAVPPGAEGVAPAEVAPAKLAEGDTEAIAAEAKDAPPEARPLEAPTKRADEAPARVAESAAHATDAPTINASVSPDKSAPKKARRAAEKREQEKPSKKKAKRKAKTPSE